MDVETNEAIERLTERIDLLEAALRDEFRDGFNDLRGELHGGLNDVRGKLQGGLNDVRGELHGGLNDVRGELHGGLNDLRGELHGGLAGVRDELREEIRESLAEAKRHALVLNEETRSDIRLVAEAVAHLSVKIDSLRR